MPLMNCACVLLKSCFLDVFYFFDDRTQKFPTKIDYVKCVFLNKCSSLEPNITS